MYDMSDDEDLPPHSAQRVFGAGIKRKPIEFVPAGTTPTQTTSQPALSTSAGDRYLSIVFKNSASSKGLIPIDAKVSSDNDRSKIDTEQAFSLENTVCDICKLPVNGPDDAALPTSKPHEASMAHMVCLKHSHPPSHLDRNRPGLKYLSFYGWDPNSRLGLGASGEGIRVPIKASVKHDTVGLGVTFKEAKDVRDTKVERLDAKQSRKRDLEERKKRERLQEIFYRHDDVERYLGGP